MIIPEFGKYYVLNNNHFYFCPTIQANVKFHDKLVVKCSSNYKNQIFFGILVTVSEYGPDREGTGEIEFGKNDVIEEYTFNDMQINYVTL